MRKTNLLSVVVLGTLLLLGTLSVTAGSPMPPVTTPPPTIIDNSPAVEDPYGTAWIDDNDPKGTTRLVGGDGQAAAGLVVYSLEEEPGVIKFYDKDGVIIGQLDLRNMMMPNPGGLLITLNGPHGTQIRVFYMGDNEDGTRRFQVNHYHQDGSYREYTFNEKAAETPTVEVEEPPTEAQANSAFAVRDATYNVSVTSVSGQTAAQTAAEKAYADAISGGANHQGAMTEANVAALRALGASETVITAAANGVDIGKAAVNADLAFSEALLSRGGITTSSQEAAAREAAREAYYGALLLGGTDEIASNTAYAAAQQVLNGG